MAACDRESTNKRQWNDAVQPRMDSYAVASDQESTKERHWNGTRDQVCLRGLELCFYGTPWEEIARNIIVTIMYST